MRQTLIAAVLAIALAAPAAGHRDGFSFSRPDATDQAERAAREDRVADALSTPCRAELRNKKIMVVIGVTQASGGIVAEQQNYGPHYRAINDRLRSLGLLTFTPEEIRRQIAQAEIDAQFRNDPDAALSASKRLGASFVLRGLINAHASRNPMMKVNQVSVTMGFTLTGSNGRLISTADAQSASYAGSDVAKMALALVNEEADAIVAKLYADYCRNAGHASAPSRRSGPNKP